MPEDTAGDHDLRILIVDQHTVSRAAVRALLRTEGLDVVADLAAIDEALSEARALSPDVTLIDISPGDARTLEIAHAIRTLPDAPAVVLTSSADRSAFEETLHNFVFVPKADVSARQILEHSRGSSRLGLSHTTGQERTVSFDA